MQHNIALSILDEHNDFAGATHLVEVQGMSSPRVCRFLNALVRHMEPHEHYLEIGTWQGLTLLSAAHNNPDKQCFACDKFRFWGRHTGLGSRVRRAFFSNLKRYQDASAKIRFFEMRSEQLFSKHLVQPPVGVYFYDGDHSRQGTREGIEAAAPLLSEQAVVLVDDWNDPNIQRGTYEAFLNANLKVTWMRSLDGDHTQRGWWNGLGVFYVSKR